jgi:hypothetical protein
MKLKSILFATSMLVFATANTAVFAAEEHHADAKVEKAEAAKTETTKKKKTVKKHSHMEEKTGMPMPEPASSAGGNESMKNMDMHDHTKDRR